VDSIVLIEETNKKTNLTEQLISHFNLSGDPFAIDNACFFKDAQREHNIETLRHLAIFGDMVLLLTGEIGAGKTSLIEYFIQTQGDELNIFVYKNPAQFIRNSAGSEKAGSVGSVNHFAELSGLSRVDGENDEQCLSRLIQQCELKFQDSAERTLFVIDDADLLTKEELALYFSLFRSIPVESGVVLLLVGTPKLLRFAAKDGDISGDEKLHQIQLKPLNNDESIDYIQCRLESVGFADPLPFTSVQRDNLAKMGKGLPGRLNRFFAYIVFELGLPETESPGKNHMARKVYFSIAGLLFLSFILVSYQHGLLKFSELDLDVIAGQELEDSNSANQAMTEEAHIIALEQEARLQMLNLAVVQSNPEIIVSGTIDEPEIAIEKSESTINELEKTKPSSDSKVIEGESSRPITVVKLDPVPVIQKVQAEIKGSEEGSSEVQKTASNTDASTKKETAKVNTSAGKINQEAPSKTSTHVVDNGAVANQDLAIKPKAFKSKSWVISQPLTNYSAQLLGSYNEETAIQFIDKAGVIVPELYYLKTLHKGRDWYVVFFGSFESKKAAQIAVSVAPKVVQKQGPWFRGFQGILSSYSK
jgi:septal ring-binding cell division protein DamX/type II secretory pathway predicted ATPase ExeA